MKSANDNDYPAKLIKANVVDEWPRCPHCKSKYICEATLSFEDLLSAWPISVWRAAGADGYAHDVTHKDLVIDCPDCSKPSIVLMDGANVKLLAARTELDDRFAGGN